MITKNIDHAVEKLNKNEVVAIPTETVYGLAANAFNDSAVKKIFELKNRPFYNPLIVHIKSLDQINSIALFVPEKAMELAKAFWPGPLTLLLKKQKNIPDLVTAGLDTVAVRIPNHPVALSLLEKLDFPLAAPSANPFGSISPTSAKHVLNYFGHKLEVILDGGDCEEGIESTIIGFESDQPILYRHGSISIDKIEEIVGKVIIAKTKKNNPEAPGMLSRHYAPTTDTYLTSNVDELIKKFPIKKIGLLLFKSSDYSHNQYVVEILSNEGNLNEAMKNLFAAMHRLDNSNLDIIIAERLPDIGLGISINDRLERAIKK